MSILSELVFVPPQGHKRLTSIANNAESDRTVRYEHLIDRAVAYIEDLHSPVHEDRLIGHVFGTSSAPDMWRPLLRSIVESDSRLVLRPDGMVSLPSAASITHDASPVDFVVLDVETTGLRPRHHRITEVAIICMTPEGETLRWSSLVNPGRSIPAYVRKLTGIDNSLVASAPAFKSIAPTILELIGDMPVVGHNISFDIGFINAELRRAGLPGLVNPAIDTLVLADIFVPESRRLSLSAVATSLGIRQTKEHRAMADAETTCQVFQEIRERAANQDFNSFDQLVQLSRKKRQPRPSHPLSRGRSILDRSHLDDIPNEPGVYIMRDSDDRVIYVGKAKDLRKRVSSYYSQPLGYTRKMDGLLETLNRLEIEVVGSELEALVLETQLIQRYQPRFNTVQRNVEQYLFVKIDTVNQWPTVTLTKERKTDGAQYFGPFRSNRQVRDAVRLINDILPIRTCRRNFKTARSYGSPCIELSLHKCAGPCVGLADRDAYRGYINDVLAFFNGDSTRLLGVLHRQLEKTVETLDYERAARIRDQITRLERLSLEHATLADAAGTGHALLVLAAARPFEKTIWYLVNGRRWAQLNVTADESPEEIASRLEQVRRRAFSSANTFVADNYSVDELITIWRMFQKNPEHEGYRDWNNGENARELATWVLAVDLSVPFGEKPERV